MMLLIAHKGHSDRIWVTHFYARLIHSLKEELGFQVFWAFISSVSGRYLPFSKEVGSELMGYGLQCFICAKISEAAEALLHALW